MRVSRVMRRSGHARRLPPSKRDLLERVGEVGGPPLLLTDAIDEDVMDAFGGDFASAAALLSATEI